MWQTKCRQIYSPQNGYFTDCYSESSPTLADHLWQTKCRQIYPPTQNGHFTDCYSVRAHLLWQLICGRPSVGRSTPHKMAISQIATLRAHLLWQIIGSTPHRMAISQIATLRAHLLWQIICGRPSVGRSTPLHRMAISQIATLRVHLLWQVVCGRANVGISIPPERQFYRVLLWELICADEVFYAKDLLPARVTCSIFVWRLKLWKIHWCKVIQYVYF